MEFTYLSSKEDSIKHIERENRSEYDKKNIENNNK